MGTLDRWREDAQSRPAPGRTWTAAARLEAVITTAALDEAGKSAWCRQHGVYPGELDKWRANCTAALAEPEEARASPQATRTDKKAHQGARARSAAQGPDSGRDRSLAGPVKKLPSWHSPDPVS